MNKIKNVKLRRKKIKNGYSLYLDIYQNGKRDYRYLGIHINKEDSRKDISLKEKMALIELENEEKKLKKDDVFKLQNNNRGVDGLNKISNKLIHECNLDFDLFVNKIDEYLKSKYKHSTYVYYYGLIKNYIIYDLGIILDAFKLKSVESLHYDTYVLRVGSSGLYKIGKTSNIEQRLKSFDLHTGKYEFIHMIKGDLEKFLHIKFKDCWIQNEFFNLRNEDIDFLKTL